MRSANRGFSLVEILVVMLIIALAVGLVAVSVGSGNRELALRAEVTQLGNNLKIVSQEAIVSGEQIGLDLFVTTVEGEPRFGYRWLVFVDISELADQQPTATSDALTEDAEGVEDDDNEKKPKEDYWEALVMPEMAADYLFPLGIQLSLLVEQTERVIDEQVHGAPPKKLTPDIALWSSGEVTPFELKFVDAIDAEVPVEEVLIADPLGRLSLQSDAERAEYLEEIEG